MNRSLTDPAWDGFAAPRAIHYLLKLATGGITLALLWWLVGPTHAAILSLAWFLSLRVHYWLEHRTDTNAERLLSLDLACDLALHAMPVAVVLPNPWRVGWFAVWFIAWGLSYPYASP